MNLLVVQFQRGNFSKLFLDRKCFKSARLRKLRHKTLKDISMPKKKLELLFCRWNCPKMNNQKPMKTFSLHSFAFYCIHMSKERSGICSISLRKKLSHFRRLRENWSINESFLILLQFLCFMCDWIGNNFFNVIQGDESFLISWEVF